MKVVCINSGGYHLDVGKIYDVDPIVDELFDYDIVNNLGYKHKIESHLFVDISVLRNNKLKTLGI